ncbi:hypothetical protein DER46DRAFT_320709 [Fusarium sp. MPI-SDFR-AT-0072]|uniref:SnoaL-like domain-containing protein n=1 Tax=Fusarium oxysporum f. sp. rapae TaxID=485398 RepID=A0A8J5NUY2_FUSOX|nr:hypothetical protein Forpe1208_v007349 [Fusarium oxysporum f. sp. rapae]KAH7164109.1 hypothetical protein DER46DRAFT_320709 [Fusarium sp. MPI-SDFR-AT-0072]
MSSDLHLSKEEAVAWLVENNAYSAKMDVDAWLDKFYTADATVQYANSPARSVMDAREMFKAIWAKFDGLEHDVIHVDYVSPCIYHRCGVRYLVKGDDPKTQEIKVPALATMLMKRDEDGNLKSYKMEVFIDPSPVFARISEKGL